MTSPIYGNGTKRPLPSSTGVGMVVGLYQPWRTMAMIPPSDQTCLLQSLQKTKKNLDRFFFSLSKPVQARRPVTAAAGFFPAVI
jgi:hypothetical protein